MIWKVVKTRFVFSNIILLLLFACQSTIPEPATTTLLPTNTIAPSQTPSPQSTQTNTPTINPTRAPSLTPLPTLSAVEARSEILELLKNNAGCKLPCWWGITPGETTWQEAVHFLNSLSTQIVRWSRGEGITQAKIIQSGGFGIYLDVPEYIRPEYNLYFTFTVSKNIITQIRAHATISLSELLSTYGKPAEVWVRVNPHTPYYSELPFYLALYYPEQRIIATYYDGLAVYSRQGYIYGCFDENLYLINNPTLKLWSPGIELSWRNINGFSHMNDIPSLEDAIGMDIETFYQTYKDPNKRPCVESPEELWDRFRFVEK